MFPIAIIVCSLCLNFLFLAPSILNVCFNKWANSWFDLAEVLDFSTGANFDGVALSLQSMTSIA